MELTVIGPNGIQDATFHIHRTGCLDVRRYERDFFCSGSVDDWGFITSKEVLIGGLFMDFFDEVDTWEDFLMDVRFFPCTEGLPHEHKEVQ